MKLRIIILMFALPLQVFAQSLGRVVVGSSGDVFNSSTGRLSLTAGEAVAGSAVGTAGILTQGFQQPAHSALACPLPVVPPVTGSNTLYQGYQMMLVDSLTGGVWTCSNTAIATVDTSGLVSGIATGTATISYTVTNSCGATSVTFPVTINTSAGSAACGTITTIAGSGTAGFSGDGVPASAARLYGPNGIVADRFGNLFFTDDFNQRLRKISATGVITTIAGTGTAGYSGDGGPATAAQLFDPGELCIDTAGNIYFTDVQNNCVRKVSTSGTISTVAGTGVGGYSGDGAAATTAQLLIPFGVAVDNRGTLYITDNGNNCIRKVDAATGIISTICGNGYAGFSGDGGAATAAQISGPNGIILDSLGNIYFSDEINFRIRRISTSGVITTICGNGSASYGGDGGPATAASINYATTFAWDRSGNLVFADAANYRIRKIDGYGNISTIAGNGYSSYSGDGGPATAASFVAPWNVAFDTTDNLFVTDFYAHTIRKVTNSAPAVSPISGPTSLCPTSTITLTDTTTGGTWSCSDTTLATIDTNGLLTARSAGNVIVTYTVTNACGTATDTQLVTITATPFVAPITGPVSVCVGSTITLSDSTPGGAWSSNDPYYAVVDTLGNVTGIIGGWKTTLAYHLPGTCGGTVYKEVWVDSIDPEYPQQPESPGYRFDFCFGDTVTWTARPGGVFSADPSDVNITESGFLTNDISTLDGHGITVYFTYTTGCGQTVTGHQSAYLMPQTRPYFTVPDTVCMGTRVLIEATMDGYGDDYNTSFGSSNDSVATVDWTLNYRLYGNTNYLVANAPGTVTITHTVYGFCGTASESHTIEIVGVPAVGQITDTTGHILDSVLTLCSGNRVTLRDTTSGGTWSCSDTSIARINASGVVTGVSAGTAIITYAVTNSCGTTFDTALIAVTAPATTLPCYLPTSGLVAWYPFNGNANDESGSGYNGSVVGAALTTDRFRIANAAYAFVDTERIVTNYNGIMAQNDRTISLWFNVDSTNDAVPLFFYGGWYGGSIQLYLDNNNRVIIDGSNSTVTYSTPASYGVWHNLVLCYSASYGSTVAACKIYLDTILLTSVSATYNPTQTLYSAVGVPVSFGGIWSYASAVAKMDDIGIWSRVLSDSERHLLYNGAPALAPISGPTSLCPASTITLTDTTTGGTWSTTDTTIARVNATGVVTGMAAGTATISYSITNSCGTSFAVKTITVNPLPNAGTILGRNYLCAGFDSVNLSNAIPGGSWSSSDSAVATLYPAPGRQQTAWGVAAGTATISYTVTNSCGTAVAVKNLTVNPLPNAGAILGRNYMCAGDTVYLSDTTVGGTWSSGDTTIARVNASGFLTSIAAGAATISYTKTNSCGTAVATQSVTVNTAPSIPSAISGSATVCTGSAITLSNATVGGVWSSSTPALASISTSGAVNGIAVGSVTVAYTLTNTCGSSSATATISVIQSPTNWTMPGIDSLCIGAAITIVDTTTGGLWVSGSPSVASVSTSGVVYGISAGTTNIQYLIFNGCGFGIHTKAVTVVSPTVAAISGARAVCSGVSATLVNTTSGGTWSSSDTTIANVSESGIVQGRAAGNAVVTYTVVNACGTHYVTAAMAVDTAGLAPISGIVPVCVGATIGLSNASAGGGWSSSAPGIATVNSVGNVTGLSSGTATIIYALSNSCATNITSASITVNPLPVVGTLAGSVTLCTGTATTYTNTSAGGTWAITNSALATVSAGGVVYAFLPGNDTITYAVTNSCGSAVASLSFLVNPSPIAGVLSGPATLPNGNTGNYTNTVTGGVWSHTNASIATLSTTGTLQAFAVGTDTIKYTVTNVCGSAVATTVVAITPSAGLITGASAICLGSTTTLSSTVPGGTWLSSSSSIASVSSTGVVRGNLAGAVTITYTVGTYRSYFGVTVQTSGVAAILGGAATLCQSATMALTNATSGGIWTNTQPTRTTVSATGVVTGIGAGADTIRYTVTNACGTYEARKYISVTGPNIPLAIGGSTAAICPGATRTNTDGTTGGVWSLARTGIATLNTTTGTSVIVTGIAGGVDTLKYTLTNSCGLRGVRTSVVNVNSAPNAGSISGPTSVVIGNSITLANTGASGTGTWSNAFTAISSVSTAGVVRGRAAGLDTIRFRVTNTCGTATARYTVSVLAAKSGAEQVVIGATTVNVFPNPSNGMITVNANEVIRHLSVTDISGKVLTEMIAQDTELNIDLAPFASGTYIVRILTDTGIHEAKIVKQ